MLVPVTDADACTLTVNPLQATAVAGVEFRTLIQGSAAAGHRDVIAGGRRAGRKGSGWRERGGPDKHGERETVEPIRTAFSRNALK
jgi:hypothetical protein